MVTVMAKENELVKIKKSAIIESVSYGQQGKSYVYILTNPSFREDWVKIGKSSRPVDIRSKELDNTAVPLSFEISDSIQ